MPIFSVYFVKLVFENKYVLFRSILGFLYHGIQILYTYVQTLFVYCGDTVWDCNDGVKDISLNLLNNLHFKHLSDKINSIYQCFKCDPIDYTSVTIVN